MAPKKEFAMANVNARGAKGTNAPRALMPAEFNNHQGH
jgi:hypothetical protein